MAEKSESDILSLNLRMRLRMLAENTGMHALPNIKRSTSIYARVCWSLVFLVAAGLLSQGVYSSYVKYYSLPTESKTEVITKFRQLFPAVTICNENAVRLSALQKYRPKLLKMLVNFTEMEPESGKVSSVMKLRQRFLVQYSTMESDVRRRLGHNISTMLLACTLNDISCNESDFIEINNVASGNCYTFNKSSYVTLSGPANGLTLVLFVEENEYLPALTDGVGIRVLIHNRSHMPFPEDEGFGIPPGQLTSIGLQRQEIIWAEKPYGPCEMNITIPHAFQDLSDNVGYSQKACQKTCMLRHILLECRCADIIMQNATVFRNITDNMNTLSCCITSEQRLCAENISVKYATNRLGCTELCPPECLNVQYNMMISYDGWPAIGAQTEVMQLLENNAQASRLMNHMNTAGKLEFLVRNTLKVKIFFSNMDIHRITSQPAYGVAALLCDLGGQMGLWLGLSVCTLFEFVELLCELSLAVFLRAWVHIGSKHSPKVAVREAAVTVNNTKKK